MKTKTKKESLNANDGMTYRLWMVCLCGCKQVVRNNWAQGHDIKDRVQSQKGR